MTKVRRVLTWSAGLLVLATSLGLSLTVATVDYEPYFQTSYYARTLQALQQNATASLQVTGLLSAGFGRARLTPVLNAASDDPGHGQFRSLPLAGYGARKGRPATGVHDDVYVKAIALRVEQKLTLVISADALIIPPEVTDLAVSRLEKEVGLRRPQLYFSATHTHASLGGWGDGMVAEAFAGGFQPGVRVWMADRIVEAVRAAVADLSAASLAQGSFLAPEFIRNRLVGKHGEVDSEFAYMVVKQADGDMGLIGCYGAHATVLPSSLMEISADYPGAWQRWVEAKTGGTALFLAGGVASHGPVPGTNGMAGVERMGQALGNELLSQMSGLTFTNRVALGMIGVDVELPPENVRLTDGWRLRPWVARRFLPVRRSTFLQALRLQNTIWVSTPCDFSGELALGIKDAFRSSGWRTVITSFNGDYIGYVVCSRYYHLNGYEPRVMSFFGPNIPDYFSEVIRRLVTVLTERSLEAKNGPVDLNRPTMAGGAP